jgi:hypothetical protein
MFVFFTPARVILAMYMAIWSPALCCCAIKSALGQVTAVAVFDCGSECCGGSMQFRSSLERSACADESECCGEAPIQTGCERRSDGCRCHDKPVDRLDTGNKVSVPGLSIDTTPVIAAPDCLSLGRSERPVISNRNDSVRRCHPPPHSLLLQRCLLTI